MISLCTCSSIWNIEKAPQSTRNKKLTHTKKKKKKKVTNKRNEKVKEKKQTFWPLSINLTAKSSLVNLSLISLATPKFPDPISFRISYRSMVSKTPKEDQPKQSLSLQVPTLFFPYASPFT
jgi:hypothetical protein